MTTALVQVKAPEDRSTEFVPVQGGGDGAGAGTLLVVAYLVMWVILVGFVFLTWKRLAATNARLDSLEKDLQKRAEGR